MGQQTREVFRLILKKNKAWQRSQSSNRTSRYLQLTTHEMLLGLSFSNDFKGSATTINEELRWENLWSSTSLAMTSLTLVILFLSFCLFEPLYRYLRTYISWCFAIKSSVVFTRNHRISKIVLCDNATSELSANTTTPDGNEKIRKTITLYVQYTFWRLSLLSLQD